MGPIKLDANKWRIDVRIKARGKEFRKREFFTGGRSQATDRYYQIRRELKRKADDFKITDYRTVGDLLGLYEIKKGNIPVKQKSTFNKLKNEFDDCPFNQFPDKLKLFIQHLKISPVKKTKRPLSDASINRILSLAKTITNDAVDEGILPHPIIAGKRFKKSKEIPRDRVLSDDEQERLLKVMEERTPYLIPIMKFALQVPSRKSELLNIRRDDIDFFNWAIWIKHGTTKNDEGYLKPIPYNMREYFKSIPKESEYAFYREKDGKFVSLGEFKTAFKKCLEKAEIMDFRFHDSRHISASKLVNNGTPERVVMQVAGWKTNMLSTYYHKSGLKALELVRFSPMKSGRLVDTCTERETKAG